jgi:hypothetical protein
VPPDEHWWHRAARTTLMRYLLRPDRAEYFNDAA